MREKQPELDLNELTRYTPNGMGMPPAQGFTHPAVLPPARKSEIFPDASGIPIWEVDLTGCLTSGAHTNSALPHHGPDIRSKVGPAQTARGVQRPHPTPNTSNLRPAQRKVVRARPWAAAQRGLHRLTGPRRQVHGVLQRGHYQAPRKEVIPCRRGVHTSPADPATFPGSQASNQVGVGTVAATQRVAATREVNPGETARA